MHTRHLIWAYSLGGTSGTSNSGPHALKMAGTHGKAPCPNVNEDRGLFPITLTGWLWGFGVEA